MKTLKEKSIDLILLGIGLQFIPLSSLGLLVQVFPDFLSNDSNLALSSILALLVLISFLVGCAIFIGGFRLYMKSKGYSSAWGWLGILGVFILLIFLWLPSKTNRNSTQSEYLKNEPFEIINVPEISLSIFLALPLLIYLIFGILFSFENLTQSILVEQLIGIAFGCSFGFILLAKLKESNLNLNPIIGYNNSINLKSIFLVTTLIYLFARGFNALTLYQLSFLAPKYVEYQLNYKSYTNILEMVLWSVSVIVLAPLTEEFFFRGIILQKWAIKWGMRISIIASSVFFAIIHFRFDIIPLFILGCILSILYIKNRNLMASVFCHFFYNALVVCFSVISYFSTPEAEKNIYYSAEKYQELIQPLLGQKAFLLAVSAPFLIYFIYKNFPKERGIIPYYANRAKSLETE